MTSDDGRNEEGGGLVTRFRGVPAEFEAGGDWQEFDLVLKNITEEELSDFTMDIQLITFHPGESLQPSHVSVQAKFDGSWEDLELWDMGGQDVDVILPVDDMKLAPGETAIPLRMKFAGDAPSVRFHIGPQADEDHAEESNEDYWESAWIIRPADPGPEPDPSSDPSVEPGPEPSEDPEPEPSADPDPEPEPSEDPGPEPSTDPEPEPSEGPDPEPEPSEDPGPEPSTDPEPEPSEDPGSEPSTDPEPEPSTDPSSSPDPGPSEEPAPGPGIGGGAATGGGAGGGGTGPAPGGAGGVPGGGTGASSGGAGQGGWTAPATGGVSASGGGLAHTGSDAVTNWALGAGGTLVLLGTALAVAGRRARRRSSGL
ncbi:hypothetical protein JHN61_07060 [Streptomyces sp. MBT67]|uniref:hypothetical protein n=1 Tax=unclassified Streptomyces TaxID=2593676 RepID=UPI00190CF1FB|nr:MULTISPECIES: hypothetical protein [unclassified Streptomyces]MBK3533442.1 hypothetical protein [Streptomyces sp. MBT72]MBK3535969.1 hypothetical protein [Streptomyces sp. MBT67]MBK3553140.1 hypothetical protein [Streptomyces sp. MBT61]MBK6031583.1 hypothetical protein [Streptomyces sp. MBT59]